MGAGHSPVASIDHTNPHPHPSRGRGTQGFFPINRQVQVGQVLCEGFVDIGKIAKIHEIHFTIDARISNFKKEVAKNRIFRNLGNRLNRWKGLSHSIFFRLLTKQSSYFKLAINLK